MTNPGWILLAWLVVALASALKFWSITRPYRDKTALSRGQTVDEARQRLERRWRNAAKFDAYFSAITQAVAAL